MGRESRFAHTIELTREEVFALESVLKNEVADEGVPVGKGLLLKLGSALLQQAGAGDTPAPVEMALSEREAWTARDCVPITMQIGHQPVGLTLKTKLYRLLLEYDTEEKAGETLKALEASERERLAHAPGGDGSAAPESTGGGGDEQLPRRPRRHRRKAPPGATSISSSESY